MPQRGGDGTVHGIIAMNDTGSNILSLFHSDIQHLGNIQEYDGWAGVASVSCASGAINNYPMIDVEVQLVRDDNTAWSDWFEEAAMVQPDSPGQLRLSGCEIRDVLYLGTSPGNHSLPLLQLKVGLLRYFKFAPLCLSWAIIT
jgi:hypothetical protein